MLSEKINTIINKQVADSTTFWAGKPKLNDKELEAVSTYAKKKGKALDKAFSPESNLDSLYKTATKKK